MKKIFILIFLFIFIISGLRANSVLSGFKNTFEKLPLPFHMIKETAEKVSSFGLKKLFFGATSAAMISEYYSSLKNKKENFQNQREYDKNIRRIISEGQIHINGIDINEAQRRALEDALYFAAVKAGVKVHGFSSINQDTSITENFTVKPESRILDFKIIKSYEENKIYKVKIEALVGNPNIDSQNCNKRRIVNLIEYKGLKTLNTNLSPDKDKNLQLISNLISNKLELDNSIKHVNNKSQYFDFNQAGFDKSYDYNTIVNGEYNLKNGDYIFIPTIKMYKTKIYPKTFVIKDGEFPKIKNLNFLDADALGFHINIKIYSSTDKNLLENIDEKYLIPLNIDSNFETIELFTKIDKEFLALELENISLDIVNKIRNKLTCKPVTAKLEFYNNKLYVKMGQNNGLRLNQLAVLENGDQNNNWTMFSVNQVSANEAELKPLNKKVNLEKLAGKKTRFLE
tara:strand:- start:2851 stop:4218 length:1368 start_codon:yes stop_codon:yes gene_type:complete